MPPIVAFAMGSLGVCRPLGGAGGGRSILRVPPHCPPATPQLALPQGAWWEGPLPFFFGGGLYNNVSEIYRRETGDKRGEMQEKFYFYRKGLHFQKKRGEFFGF